MPANPPNATPFFFAAAVLLSFGWGDCGILLLASFTCTVEGSVSSLDILVVLVSCSGSSRVTASSATSKVSVVVVSCDAVSSTGSATAPDSTDTLSAATPAKKGIVIVPQMPPPADAPPWSSTRGEQDMRRRTPRADNRVTCILPRLYAADAGAAPYARFLALVGIAVVERPAGRPPLLADAPRPVMIMRWQV